MAEFTGAAAQRVDQLGALTHQGIAHFQDHALGDRARGGGLLFGGFHWHDMHAGTPGGLADRFGVVAVVFRAFDEGFHVLRRDQFHPVAKRPH
jgi:hypothetical protein